MSRPHQFFTPPTLSKYSVTQKYPSAAAKSIAVALKRIRELQRSNKAKRNPHPLSKAFPRGGRRTRIRLWHSRQLDTPPGACKNRSRHYQKTNEVKSVHCKEDENHCHVTTFKTTINAPSFSKACACGAPWVSHQLFVASTSALDSSRNLPTSTLPYFVHQCSAVSPLKRRQHLHCSKLKKMESAIVVSKGRASHLTSFAFTSTSESNKSLQTSTSLSDQCSKVRRLKNRR